MPVSGYSLHVAIPALQAPGNGRPGGDERGGAATDEQLVERCRAGSEAAFAEIVTRHEAALRRHCSLILGRSAAEDAVQDAFVSAWIALHGNASVSELRPWLMVIAHRKALSLKRRSRYTSELTDAIPGARSSAQEAAQAARAREALAALATLPATQREALIGSALHGRSGAQLAHQLGVTEPTVRQLVFRARDRMRRAIPACAAPPLAFLRLIRRATAGAGRAASAPGSFAAGTVLKAGAVLVIGAAAVGAGETLDSSRHGGRAPAVVAPSATTFAVRHAAASPASPAVERGHTRSGSRAPSVRHRAAGSPAAPSSTSLRRTPAVAAAPARAQPEHGGVLAATAASAPARRVDPVVASVAAHVRGADPAVTQRVAPLVNSLGSAGRTTVAGVTGALGVVVQTVAGAGQTAVSGVQAVVNATTSVAQGALTSVPSAGATVQSGQTGVTGVAAPMVSGLGGVVQGLGATGASGPLHIPGIG